MKEDVQLTQIFVDKYKCMVHLVIMFNRVHINMNLYSLNFQQVVHEYNENLRSNRTLSYVGERASYLSVKCMNAIIHSYTVMPIISAAGYLLSPVFICLQERTGRFPVMKTLFSATNIY